MKFKGKNIFTILSVFFVLFVTAWVLGEPIKAEDDAEGLEHVRVGFFQFDGYNEIGEEGVKSGYGYDFLQMLAGYSKFDYEYVGYEKSWEDMLDMLENGDIDMLTFARYTEERSEVFDYSEVPMGYSTVVLSTRGDQECLKSGDFSSYEGMKVGIISQSVQAAQMETFAKEHDFSYEPVYYSTLAELKEALFETKEVDAILTNSVRKIEGEVILEVFDETPFYVIVKKGNKELLNKIDYGMNLLNTYNSDWKGILSEKYYSTGTEISSLGLTEKKYLEQLKADGGTLRVLVNPDSRPYSYVENGCVKGILVDYFDEICSFYGLKAEYVQAKNSEDYYKLILDKSSADVILAPNIGIYEADTGGYYLTPSFLEATISLLSSTQQTAIRDGGKIAVTRGMTSIIYSATVNFRENEIVYFDSMDECVEAVRKGTVDGALLYTYSVYEYMNEDWRNIFQMQDVSGKIAGFCIAVPKEADTSLYILMCNAINRIDETSAQKLVEQGIVSTANSREPLWLHIYRNPVLVLVIVLVLLFCVSFVLIMINKKVKAIHLERSRKAEYEATHDALTGALNRNAYNKLLEGQSECSTKIGALMLDIDYFKQINDSHGHEMGDRVLQEVATLLKGLFRNEDYLIRLGGDEFILILQECDAKEWDVICQRLVSAQKGLVDIFSEDVAPTLSAGICFTDKGFSEKIAKYADIALYNTKNKGRAGCSMTDDMGNIIDYWKYEV